MLIYTEKLKWVNGNNKKEMKDEKKRERKAKAKRKSLGGEKRKK